MASKGSFGWQSRWLWTLKDQIDRKFMHKYGRDLPRMSNGGAGLTADSTGKSTMDTIQIESRMRCAGCGGKVQEICKVMLLIEVVKAEDSNTVLAVPGWMGSSGESSFEDVN